MNVLARAYPELAAGGFTAVDGTFNFYTRVNALLRPEMTVIDFGAGRSVLADYPASLPLGTLRGKVRRVIGVDVDPIVRENPVIDEAIVYDGRDVPLPDGCADLMVADHVLEHIADPAQFAAEATRLLRPGGWLCARTPHLYSLVVLASALTPNRHHAAVLARAQPGRKAADVFPTVYKLNTRAALARHFPGWRDCSYTWTAEPGYHFNSLLLLRLLQAYQYIKKPILGGEVLLIFLQRPA